MPRPKQARRKVPVSVNLFVDQIETINAMGFTVSQYVRDLLDITLTKPLSDDEKKAIEDVFFEQTKDIFDMNHRDVWVLMMRKRGFTTPLKSIVEYATTYMDAHPEWDEIGEFNLSKV